MVNYFRREVVIRIGLCNRDNKTSFEWSSPVKKRSSFWANQKVIYGKY
jgi:hypothetical protein